MIAFGSPGGSCVASDGRCAVRWSCAAAVGGVAVLRQWDRGAWRRGLAATTELSS